MERRQFLKSGPALLSVAIAGCAHPPVVLDMDAATADDIANEVSQVADPDLEKYTLIKSAIENGSATRSGQTELFDRIDTVRVDDSFYKVSETRLKRTEVTVYEVRLDFEPDDTTPDIDEIEYTELPETDRNQLGPVVSEDDSAEQDDYEISVKYGTAEDVANKSVLVPEQQYDILVYNGNRYRVAVDTRTVSDGEYRYETTMVASDVASFADQVQEQYLFTLADLSDAEREVVEEAIESGYFEDGEAFQSVINRIRDHEGISVEDFYGTWLVRYDRDDYLTYAEW